MPLFSLVIPTLRRPDTLRHSLATLLRQPQRDVEIIVQNNGDDDATRRLVGDIGDARVRHRSSDSVLAMGDNWEAALDACRGEWIIFIGDDDGLLPDACETMSALDGLDDYELVTWTPFIYLWPQYDDERRRNRIEAEVDSAFRLRPVASEDFLVRFYRFEEHYSRLPMIYNSFVRRSLIDRVRARHGRYFLGSLADVTSGIVNASACDVFVRSTRPLSISGVSRHSTGHNTWNRPGAAIKRDEFERDFPLLGREAARFPAWNFELAIANEMQVLREQVLGGDERFAFDDRRFARHVADAINNRPDRYEDTLAVVESMVDRLGIPRDEIRVPPKVDRSPVVPVGEYPLGRLRSRLVVDGDAAGLGNIDDAARFAAGLLPAAETAAWEEEPTAIPVVSAQPLSFAAEEDGERALLDGWSESEAWGTWSIGRESRIRFALAPDGGRRRLALKYRVIAAENTGPLRVQCASEGEVLDRWTLGHENHQGQLTIELPPSSAQPEAPVELTFSTENPRSPAELGLGPDTRQLGIGVEELRVVG
jgi:glycosyltransferase involved in cell wall biosynthesis